MGGSTGGGARLIARPAETRRGLVKIEGSTREAGPIEMKSACGSLGLSFCSAFLVPIMVYFVVKPVRLAINVTIRIFNSRVIRER